MLCLHKKFLPNPLKGYRFSSLQARLRENCYPQLTKSLPPYLPVPCGDCPICRLHATAETLCRLIAESYNYNWIAYFVTFTKEGDVYDVDKKDVTPLTDAIRLSNRVNATRYRYYITSEYGSRTDRPHYHGIFFGFNGRFDCLEFVKKYYTLGHLTCEPVTLARFRYTANAHVNKCSHVPFKPVIEDDATYLLRCAKPFVTCSQKLGVDYAVLHADSILRDGYLKIDGIAYPVPRTMMDYVYKSRGLDPFLERLRRYSNPDVFDSLDAYRKIAEHFNYNTSDINESTWLYDLRQYLDVAESSFRKTYVDKFVNKNNSYSV